MSNSPDRSPRNTVPIQRILIEAFSIVFAVLLALGVDEWRETRQQEERAERAFSHIQEEMRSNQTFLARLHENNTATLAVIQNDPDGSNDTTMSFVPGLQLKSSAWETAKSMGIFAYMEYGDVLRLSDIYAIQDIYREIGFQMTQAMMQANAEAIVRGHEWDESRTARGFESWMDLLVSAEAGLLQRYEEQLGPLRQDEN